MKKDLYKILQDAFLFSLVLVVAYLFGVDDVLAQEASGGGSSSGSSSVIAQIGQRAAVAIEYIKPIAYILGGFGLIGLAWGAIFGKLNWKWFGSLAIGLFLIAYMGMAIDFFVGSKNRHFSTATKFKTTGISASHFEDTIKVPGSNSTSTTETTDTEITGDGGGENGGSNVEIPDEPEEPEEDVLSMMSCDQLYAAWQNQNSQGNSHGADVFANAAMQKGCDFSNNSGGNSGNGNGSGDDYTPPTDSQCETYSFQCQMGDSMACGMFNGPCGGSAHPSQDALCQQLKQQCEQGGPGSNAICAQYQAQCQ